MPRRALRHAAVGAALVAALVLTGCNNGGAAPPDVTDPPTSSEPTTGSPTPKTPAEKATAALERYLKVRDAAYRAANLDLKILNRVATGDEFLRIQHFVTESIQVPGIKFSGQYEHTLGAAEQRGQNFVIVDCEDSSGVVRTVGGETIGPDEDPNGDPLRNPVPVEYTLTNEDSRWLVSKSNILWDQPC